MARVPIVRCDVCGLTCAVWMGAILVPFRVPAMAPWCKTTPDHGPWTEVQPGS